MPYHREQAVWENVAIPHLEVSEHRIGFGQVERALWNLLELGLDTNHSPTSEQSQACGLCTTEAPHISCALQSMTEPSMHRWKI